MDLPRTRAEAKARNIKRYFTGTPCRRGHTVFRYTSSGACSACMGDRQLPDATYRDGEMDHKRKIHGFLIRRASDVAKVREFVQALNAAAEHEQKASIERTQQENYARMDARLGKEIRVPVPPPVPAVTPRPPAPPIPPVPPTFVGNPDDYEG